MSKYVVERIRLLKQFGRDHKVSPIRANELATAWEYEANRRGADTRTSVFWRHGRAWMEAQLRRRKPGRHEAGKSDS